MKRNIVMMLALALPLAVQAQTEVPHEFQPGTRALSAEVNENFDTLETATNENGARISETEAGVAENAEAIQVNESNINNNATSISINSVSINENLTAIENNSSAITMLATASGVHVYSQGESIGRFLSLSNFIGDFGDFWAISDPGYVFLVNPMSHQRATYLVESKIVFSGEDCTGDAYVVLDWLETPFKWAAIVGHVIRLKGPLPQPAYYTKKGSELSKHVGYLSVYDESCRNKSSPHTAKYAVRVLPNDPEVTGVSDMPPARPLTLGSP
jgi:hypothetical protein